MLRYGHAATLPSSYRRLHTLMLRYFMPDAADATATSYDDIAFRYALLLCALFREATVAIIVMHIVYHRMLMLMPAMLLIHALCQLCYAIVTFSPLR